MSNGSYHTLYSMRRAIAQKAYDENLEEEYFIDNFVCEDVTSKEIIKSVEPISRQSKAIKKKNRISK